MGTKNSQEIVNSQEKTAVELSVQDQRVKKICERVFWCNFVFLFLSVPVIGMLDLIDYIEYFGAFFFVDVITLPILFIGYWKLIRKEPIPDWFKSSYNFSENENWGSFGFGHSKIFSTDCPRSISSTNYTFHDNTSRSSSYVESNAHRYFIQNTSHNYSHNRRNHR